MNREELLDYTYFVIKHIERGVTPAWLVDKYMNNPFLPPAEGAEEILDAKEIYLDLCFKNIQFEDRLKLVVMAMEKYATLHAQRIADKIVEERMEQYKAQFKDRPNPLEVNPYDSKGIKRIRNRKIH